MRLGVVVEGEGRAPGTCVVEICLRLHIPDSTGVSSETVEKQALLKCVCLSRESREKTKCGWISPRTHSDGPVSQTCLHRLLGRELLRAFVTLDDSTPQRRISELRVWSYEPFIVFAPSSSGYTSGQNLEVLYIIRNGI